MMRTSICGFVGALSMCGCAAVSDITGAVVGFATGAVTGNPAVAIGVGILVRAGTSEVMDRVSRTQMRSEHDAIAAIAAPLKPGEAGVWALNRRIGGDTGGEIRVLRVIQTPIATCKEVLFSVVAENGARWFTTTACQQGDEWKWAAAEPAVSRWLNLQ